MPIFNQIIPQFLGISSTALEMLLQSAEINLIHQSHQNHTKKLAQPLNNSFFLEEQKNIAILRISGVIFPHENTLSQLLGATTLGKLTQDFQQALKTPAISQIILTMDSPGGVVTGVHECADMIYQARGKKRKVQKEKNGLTQTQIVSSQSPRKRLDVATEEERADVQAQVDAIAIF